jgi:hypothetical protein
LQQRYRLNPARRDMISFAIDLTGPEIWPPVGGAKRTTQAEAPLHQDLCDRVR